MLLIDLAFFRFLSLRSGCELYRKAASLRVRGLNWKDCLGGQLLLMIFHLLFCLVHAASIGAKRYMLLGLKLMFTILMEQSSTRKSLAKDTLSNLNLGFQHQTQLPFPHTNFRGMDRSDSFFMGNGRETGKLYLFKT